MLTKVCLVTMVVLLLALMTNQQGQGVAHAQGGIVYKAVDADVFVAPEGQPSWRHDTKYYSTQEALDEYGKSGWVLVTASYDREHKARLIFIRK